jgi:protocatechuate 3,4-dioxygenase beta subunit
LVDFWQADEEGAYDQDGPTFRGHQLTAEDGSYSLSTIVPGRYLNGAEFRPAHVHVRITIPGYIFVTQLYFPGDPYNDVDFYFRPELLVTLTTDGGADLIASFDFYLPAAP